MDFKILSYIQQRNTQTSLLLHRCCCLALKLHTFCILSLIQIVKHSRRLFSWQANIPIHTISSDIRQNTCFSNTPVVEIQVTLFTFSSVVAYFSLSKCLLAQCITQSIGCITLSYCNMVWMFCTNALFPQRASQTISLFLHLMLLSFLVKTKHSKQLRTRDSKNLIHFAAVVSSYPFMQVLYKRRTTKCSLPMFGKPKSFTEIEFDRYIIVKAHMELKG